MVLKLELKESNYLA